MRAAFAALVVALLGSPVQAQDAASFWLRNNDPAAVFCWWTVKSATPASLVLAGLPLAPGGLRRAAPGERVAVKVAADEAVLGVFVPWSEPLSWLSILRGGLLPASQAPARGTVILDRAAWAAATVRTPVEAPLQAWALSPPTLALDGRPDKWRDLPPALDWGPKFQPGGQAWPSFWPRPQSLSVVNREEALWIRLVLDRSPATLPAGSRLALTLRRPGRLLRWPLVPADPVVWAQAEDGGSSPVGALRWEGSVVEAWVPWERLEAAERRAWASQPAVWSLLVADAAGERALDLGPFAAGDLP